MSSADPTAAAAASTASPAATTTTAAAPAATVAKNNSAIHVLMNFPRLLIAQLIIVALTVLKGMTNNPAFSNPPVDMPGFAANITNLQNAQVAAQDSKAAKALCNKYRLLVCQDLKQLAVYVENNCNDDPAIFITSGLTAKTSTKTKPGPVSVPWFKSITHGKSSGQILIAIKAVRNAKSYNFRYAVMTGGLPGNWTTIPVGGVKQKVTISGLTPGTLYGFQVQALGQQGLSDFNTIETFMAT